MMRGLLFGKFESTSLVTPEWPAFLPSKWSLPDSLVENALVGAEEKLRDLVLAIPDANTGTHLAMGRPAEALADAGWRKVFLDTKTNTRCADFLIDHATCARMDQEAFRPVRRERARGACDRSAVLGHVLSMAEVTEHRSLSETDVDRVFSNDKDGWRKQMLDAGIPVELVTTEIAFGEVSEEVLATAEHEGADIIIREGVIAARASAL